MSLARCYASAVRQALARHDDAVLLPLALVEACVDVLAVDGAGLSLTQELRVPLSASDAVVGRAERLQVTLGEGPCLSAAGRATPLVADAAALSLRWPVFHTELVRQTPFRSIASLPIRLPSGQGLGAVDLYSRDEQGAPFAAVPHAGPEIADQVATFLLRTSGWLRDGHALGPHRLELAADRRLDVWVAVGMVIGHTGMANVDALALLRAYAFSHDLDLDELAARLTSHRLAVDALVDAARPAAS